MNTNIATAVLLAVVTETVAIMVTPAAISVLLAIAAVIITTVRFKVIIRLPS